MRISDWSSDVCSSDLCHQWRAGSSSWALFPSLGAWLRRRLGPIRDSASLDPTEDRAGSQIAAAGTEGDERVQSVAHAEELIELGLDLFPPFHRPRAPRPPAGAGSGTRGEGPPDPAPRTPDV